jgi:hypothetical protein
VEVGLVPSGRFAHCFAQANIPGSSSFPWRGGVIKIRKVDGTDGSGHTGKTRVIPNIS